MPCIDIIVVKQPNGEPRCSPFFVYFENVPDSKEDKHYIQVYINGQLVHFREEDETRLVLHANEHFALFEKKVLEVVTPNDFSSDGSISPAPSPRTHGALHDRFGRAVKTAAHRTKPLLSEISLGCSAMMGNEDQAALNSGNRYSRYYRNVSNHTKQRVKQRWKRNIDTMQKKLGSEFTTPPQELLQRIDWSKEVNTVEFVNSVTREVVRGRLFLWSHADKIVVSDIDGTITKSDIKGQIATRWLGRQYAHPGVANLFQGMTRKGYKILYLTVRSINQETSTIDYIHKLRQGESSLPLGPVITPPVSGHSIMRWKMPSEFKISTLSTIKALFPCESVGNPFIAGWGNRDTDKVAYLGVGIQPERIWLINKKGIVVTPAKDEHSQQLRHWRGYGGLINDIDSVFKMEQLSEKVPDVFAADANDPQSMSHLHEKVDEQLPTADEIRNDGSSMESRAVTPIGLDNMTPATSPTPEYHFNQSNQPNYAYNGYTIRASPYQRTTDTMYGNSLQIPSYQQQPQQQQLLNQPQLQQTPMLQVTPPSASVPSGDMTSPIHKTQDMFISIPSPSERAGGNRIQTHHGHWLRKDQAYSQQQFAQTPTTPTNMQEESGGKLRRMFHRRTRSEF